jgi:hypothetical protein
MVNDKDLNNFLSIDNTEVTYNNLIKNQESDTLTYKTTESEDIIIHNNNLTDDQQYNVKYVMFSKWTWKSMTLSILAIIVLIILIFSIIKYYTRK